MNSFTDFLLPPRKFTDFITFGDDMDWRYCECDHFSSMLVIEGLERISHGPCSIELEDHKITIESVFPSLINDLEKSVDQLNELNVLYLDSTHIPRVRYKFTNLTKNKVNKTTFEIIADRINNEVINENI